MALPATTYDTATLVNPGSSLTDFTLIVDLSRMSAAWWTAVDTSDGTKGRAAKDSGPTELACDWIDFDSVNETGLLRVKWSGTLSNTGTQTLRIYPPQAANASVSVSDTYGRNNAYGSTVLAYWPMNDTTDRTGNGYTLADFGSVNLGGGSSRIGGVASADFTGLGDYCIASIATSSSQELCFLCWLYPDASVTSAVRAFHHARPTASNNQYAATCSNNNNIVARTYDGSNIGQSGFGTGPTASTWQHVIGYHNQTSERKAYKDGTLAGTANTTSLTWAGDEVWLGASNNNIWQYEGDMSDAMILEDSDARALYEYEQSSDQATFWGTWTNVPVAAGISIPVVMHHRRMIGVS